jgi:hypothetical protein
LAFYFHFTVEFDFKNWHFILPEDGTLAPKHDGEAHLMFVLIEALHLFGIINGVR